MLQSEPKQNLIQSFRSREQFSLPHARSGGWYLKRYAIVSDSKQLDLVVCAAALSSAFERLPKPGSLHSVDGNHGIGFQIVHFAEVAVVSPVFYWQWGSVIANIDQMRAPLEQPTQFATGVKEVVGCVWEMTIVNFELQAWMNTVMNSDATPDEKLNDYVAHRMPSAIFID